MMMAAPMKTQISKRIMKRLAMLLVPLLAVGALTVAAQAGHRVAKVNGNGIVTMEATADDTVYGVFEEGALFADNHFKIQGKVNADGSANGTAHFVFGDEFANAWGADAMTLECEIDTGSVSDDGTVVLQGSSFEEDFDEFGNVIFEELSPFEIIIDPSGSFSLRWCALPALNLEITKGHLKVK
jgi:hypothetical protein